MLRSRSSSSSSEMISELNEELTVSFSAQSGHHGLFEINSKISSNIENKLGKKTLFLSKSTLKEVEEENSHEEESLVTSLSENLTEALETEKKRLKEDIKSVEKKIKELENNRPTKKHPFMYTSYKCKKINNKKKSESKKQKINQIEKAIKIIEILTDDLLELNEDQFIVKLIDIFYQCSNTGKFVSRKIGRIIDEFIEKNSKDIQSGFSMLHTEALLDGSGFSNRR